MVATNWPVPCRNITLVGATTLLSFPAECLGVPLYIYRDDYLLGLLETKLYCSVKGVLFDEGKLWVGLTVRHFKFEVPTNIYPYK